MPGVVVLPGLYWRSLWLPLPAPGGGTRCRGPARNRRFAAPRERPTGNWERGAVWRTGRAVVRHPESNDSLRDTVAFCLGVW